MSREDEISVIKAAIRLKTVYDNVFNDPRFFSNMYEAEDILWDSVSEYLKNTQKESTNV